MDNNISSDEDDFAMSAVIAASLNDVNSNNNNDSLTVDANNTNNSSSNASSNHTDGHVYHYTGNSLVDACVNIHGSGTTTSTRPANQSGPAGSAAVLTNHNDSHETDDSSDIMVDALESPASPAASNMLPLIPSDCDDIHEAQDNFLRVFEARYGDKHPIFNAISLFDAIQDLQASHYSTRKPILLYLHDDDSVMAQIFCTQVLCAPAVIDFINSNFFLWAWDFTLAENRTKMIEWIETALGPQRSLQVRVCTKDDFPVLVVLGKVTGGLEIINVIKGTYMIEHVMLQLMNSLDACQAQNKLEQAEEAERHKREEMRNEQLTAYNESLQADKLKAQMKMQEEKRVQEEQQNQINAEREKEERRQQIEDRLQPEPDEKCKQPTTNIRIRVVGVGENLERRFLLSEPLSHLFDYAASKKFSVQDFKLMTSYPKRDLTTIDPTKTFAELNFGPREVIIIEAR